MANTISILSYTNTFGDWFVNTNALAKENNEFGSNNYIKPTGTLYLNDTNLGLQVANNAIIGGQLQVQGIGSSAYVQNNLRVDTQVYFTNTSLGLTNSGQAIIGKDLLVLGSGTGLRVANNTLIGGTLTANGITQLNNDLNVSGNTSISNTVYIRGNSYLANSITVSKDVWTNNLTTSGVATVGTNLNVINNSYTVNLQANNVVNTAIVTASDIIYGKNIQANTNLQTQTLNVIGTEYVNIVSANTRIETPKLIITSDIDANAASILTNSLQTTGQLTVGGNFVINGTTVYNTNNFTINAGSSVGLDSVFQVNRGSSGSNASIKWSESDKSFGILNVGTGTYWKVVTEEYISGSLSSISSTNVASSLAANTLNTNINNANTWLKAYTDTSVTNANTQLKAYTDGAIASANGNIQSQFGTVYTFATNAYTRANTSANSFVGTTGTAVPSTGVVTFNSGNGVTVSGSGSTLTINTPQNLRTTDSPTFSSLTLSSPLAIAQGGTGSSSSSGAAINLLNGISNPGVSGYVLATNGSGNYYWTANTGAASGTVAPGTTINSTRLLYSGATANAGQTLFTTPTYSTSAQLRVYINGVRQFYTEYTETSNTSVTLSSGISSGDVVMLEVDGYIINPYYANNITFTAPQGGIVSTANTIQLAINDLESRKATLVSPTFTGLVIAPTIDTNASNTVVATTAWVNNKANSGTTFSHNITGNAGTVTNGVYTSGDQTIAGNKTFSSTIAGSINGNAGTVTNGVYTTGDQTIGGTKTFSSTIAGSINGNAGTSSTAYALYTGNNYQVNSIGVGTGPSGTTGEIRATDNITAYYSDRRLKENIQVIDNPLSKIQNISGVYFNNNALAETFGYKNKSKQIGVIAQEIQNVIPEAVKMAPFDTDFDENGKEYSKSGEEYLTVQYEKIIPLLIESIKELKAEIDELKGNNK